MDAKTHHKILIQARQETTLRLIELNNAIENLQSLPGGVDYPIKKLAEDRDFMRAELTLINCKLTVLTGLFGEHPALTGLTVLSGESPVLSYMRHKFNLN